MTSDEEQLPRPPPLQSKLSTRSLISVATNQLPASFLGSDATTAITLASSDQAELALYEDGTGPTQAGLAQSSRLGSPQPESVILQVLLAVETTPFVELLHEFVNTLEFPINSIQDGNGEFNVLTGKSEPLDELFMAKCVFASKQKSSFLTKLKHFFILLPAGKPIYSFNGDDEVLLGYSGLITTIVASFEEGTGLLFRSISTGSINIVVMNKTPLIFVAITRVSYELNSGLRVLERQLQAMYDHILAVLSGPTITKSFHNRMNYDLRRVLSAQDLRNLDKLASQLTYGFYDVDGDNQHYAADPSLSMGVLLGGALQCTRLSDTLRQKLNGIIISCKRIKVSQPALESTPFLQGKLYSSEVTKHLAADLLFAFLVYEGKLVCFVRSKSHLLSNNDINTLLSTVAQGNEATQSTQEPDLWVPICLPDFNDSGFLHCYSRLFFLENLSKPITLLLISGNKNSFFDMKQSANFIIAKINKSQKLLSLLPIELAQSSQPLTSYLDVPQIKHFVYKRRKAKQFYMDPISCMQDQTQSLAYSMHLLYLYTALFCSKAQEIKYGTNLKKVTYTRWHIKEGYTGFLLSDENYEFYCISAGLTPSLIVIKQSLRIINWCERYKKRLFLGDGCLF